MSRKSKFSSEVRERAVRLVQEHAGEYETATSETNARGYVRLTKHQDWLTCLAKVGPGEVRKLPLRTEDGEQRSCKSRFTEEQMVKIVDAYRWLT